MIANTSRIFTGLLALVLSAPSLFALEPLFTIPQDNKLPDGFELIEPKGGEDFPLGAPGSGLSGKPDSVSFDNSSATGMGLGKAGALNSGRLICAKGPLDKLRAISSFTACGWLKSEGAKDQGNGGARIVTNRVSVKQPGFDVMFDIRGLSLRLNEQPFIKPDAKLFNIPPGEWTFFAVTVDSPRSIAKFYLGNSSQVVRLIAESPIEPGTDLGSDVASLAVGNIFPTLDRPFQGFLDHVRVFAVETGSAGSLSEGDLEAIRAADCKR